MCLEAYALDQHERNNPMYRVKITENEEKSYVEERRTLQGADYIYNHGLSLVNRSLAKKVELFNHKGDIIRSRSN